jgi:hypothetical protein
MPVTESFRFANAPVAAATASLATTTAAARSAAMENNWSAPLPRTYFVGGFRVEHELDSQGHSRWTCDCEEFQRARQAATTQPDNDESPEATVPPGSAETCQHTRRIAAAVELDALLRTPGLVLPTGCY